MDDIHDIDDIPEDMKDPNNPDYLMYHINRLTKPGGKLIFNTNNESSDFLKPSINREERRRIARQNRKRK